MRAKFSTYIWEAALLQQRERHEQRRRALLRAVYQALEELSQQVPFAEAYIFFENRIAERAGYHRELLWRMKIPIEGVRPALLSEESYALLDSLRAFRHFFRHAYGAELDPKKIALVLEDAMNLKLLYNQEIERFLEQLRP